MNYSGLIVRAFLSLASLSAFTSRVKHASLARRTSHGRNETRSTRRTKDEIFVVRGIGRGNEQFARVGRAARSGGYN